MLFLTLRGVYLFFFSLKKTKLMKHTSLLALVLVFICTLAQAQSLKSWTWETYKMKFKLPDNMTVDENNADKFEATNNLITLDIYPRTGENLTYSGMQNAVINWAYKTGLRYSDYNKSGDSQPIYLKDLNGYWGCAIDGTKDGLPASMLLLVDPDYTDISFYIWISYSDDYYHDAVQILKSFEPK
jgi:hypothetical protein